MARFTNNTLCIELVRASRVCVFNVPGSNSWTVPSGVTCATFELWGAGGAGGARCCCDCYHQGAGGSTARYMAASMYVAPGTTYTLCIGCAWQHDGSSGSGIGFTHYYCCGPAGQGSSVTGNGISTLCAGPGSASNNDCYTYCLCSNCCTGLSVQNQCASLANPFPIMSSICENSCCGVQTIGAGNRGGSGHVGQYSDSQGYYYFSTNAGGPWRSNKILTINHCCTAYRSNACQQGWAGMGGDGAYAGLCCCCMEAGVGRNGLILIRF